VWSPADSHVQDDRDAEQASGIVVYSPRDEAGRGRVHMRKCECPVAAAFHTFASLAPSSVFTDDSGFRGHVLFLDVMLLHFVLLPDSFMAAILWMLV
jgi:hypothetical protein